jgi:hypothetical protein
MIRPKSEQTLILERERSIRKERLDLKKAAREKRRAWRAERKRFHELAINADLKPKGLPQKPVVELIEFQPLLRCSICHENKRGDPPDRSADFVCEECLRKGGAEEKEIIISPIIRLEGKGRKRGERSAFSLQKNLFKGDNK